MTPACAELRAEVLRLHAGKRKTGRAIVARGCLRGLVVVAVCNALGLVILECAVRLVAADEAVAFFARAGYDARRIAVFIDISAVDGSSDKAAGVAARRNVSEREAVADGAAVAQAGKAARVVALGVHVHGRPAALNEAALFIRTDKSRVARSRGGVGVEPTAAHIASADDAVVPARHAAHDAADVGRDVAADDRAVFDHAVVIEREHSRRAGKIDVGVHDRHIVDIAFAAREGKQAGVGIRERQPADLKAVSVELALEHVGLRADGFCPVLVGGGEFGEVDIVRQPVVFAPFDLLHACRTRIARVGRHILGIRDFHPLRGGRDLNPLGRRLARGRIRRTHLRADGVVQTVGLVERRIGDGRDGKGIASLRSEGASEIGLCHIARNLKALYELVPAACDHVEVQLIGLILREVVLPRPLGDGPAPRKPRHRLHARVGVFGHILLGRRGIRAVGLDRSHGRVIHAVFYLGERFRAVVARLIRKLDRLYKLKLRKIVAERKLHLDCLQNDVLAAVLIRRVIFFQRSNISLVRVVVFLFCLGVDLLLQMRIHRLELLVHDRLQTQKLLLLRVREFRDDGVLVELQ